MSGKLGRGNTKEPQQDKFPKLRSELHTRAAVRDKMTICENLLSLCQVNVTASFHAYIPANVQDFLHPSLKQILGSTIKLSFSSAIYIHAPLSDLNLLLFLFQELHHSDDLFVLYNSIIHSSVDSHTSHLIIIFPSLQFSYLHLCSALDPKLILLSSSSLVLL